MQTTAVTSRLPTNGLIQGAALLVIFCCLALAAGTLRAEDASIEDVLAEQNDEFNDMAQMIAAGEYALPQAWLTARVKKIERSSHRFDPQLVRPLTMLGDIAAEQGKTDEAFDYYGQALHIQRVSEGLVSAEQVEIVHREADLYRNLGDLKRANEREEYAYHVLRRAYRNYDEKLLPGLYRLANWYLATHNVYAARALYQQCLDILTANGQGDTETALPALKGMVETYKLERFPPVYLTSETAPSYGVGMSVNSAYSVPISLGTLAQGEQALQQIVQIHRDNGNDPHEVAESVLDLADWYLLLDKERRALPLYDYAYDLLAATDNTDAVSYFAEPKLLHFPAPVDPRPPSMAGQSEPLTGYVELRYDVSDDGFIRNLETIASDPEGMMDFRVRKSMRAARYRPALVDGVPVATEAQTFRHEFTYYPTVRQSAQETAGMEAVQ